MIVCRHITPAPGAQWGPEPCCRNPDISCQLLPPSVVRKRAASSTPAYTVSGSVNEGSRCHTRLNSHGCCVPSYHWWGVRGAAAASYTNLLLSALEGPSGGAAGCPAGVPGWCQVFPPSSER